MFKIIQLIKIKLSEPQYRLEGQCNRCGTCCKLMYALDDWTPGEFKLMQFLFPSYKRFEIAGKDEKNNLMFKCNWLQADNTCKNYPKRLDMCKNFPNVRYGSLGNVPEGCGYRLVPVNNFENVYNNTLLKKAHNRKEKIKDYLVNTLLK